MDDIYEYKTDHQYFTHTGQSRSEERPTILSDAQRNQLFQRTLATQSMDEGSTVNNGGSGGGAHLLYRKRFDNSSFAKSLNDSTGDMNNQKDKKSHNHHHHSIQEMIKHFGKKAHLWPRKRHDSTSNLSNSPLVNDPQENFRVRSKSLDVDASRKILSDCESTYKIFDKIVNEGIIQMQLN